MKILSTKRLGILLLGLSQIWVLGISSIPMTTPLDLLEPSASSFQSKQLRNLQMTPDFDVSTRAEGLQESPKLALLKDGQFVVVFGSENEAGAGTGKDIAFRLFDTSGNPVSNNILVHEVSAGDQVEHKVAALKDGCFIVVWRTLVSGKKLIKYRVFWPDGSPRTGETSVDDQPGAQQEMPAVGGLSAGGFVIAWSDDGNQIIRAKIFSSTFDVQVDTFQVNTATGTSFKVPEIIPLLDNTFVAVWCTYNSGYRVKAQKFNAAGVPQGTEFAVSSTSGDQYNPVGASSTSMDYIVVWEEPISNSDIYYRRFQSDGTPKDASNIKVNFQTNNRQINPSVAWLSRGGIAIAFQSEKTSPDTADFGIFIRVYDNVGNPLETKESIVNQNLRDDQEQASIIPFGAGFVVAWKDKDGVGEGDIKLRIYILPDKEKCVEDSDCTDNLYPYCIESTGVCVACTPSLCTNPYAPVCTSKGCGGCTSNMDCRNVPGKPKCDTSSSTCTACTGDSDCPDPFYKFCDPVLFKCVWCLSGETCIPECPTNPCPPEKPYCYDNHCVACRLDTDCNTGEVCSSTNTCVAPNTTPPDPEPTDPGNDGGNNDTPTPDPDPTTPDFFTPSEIETISPALQETFSGIGSAVGASTAAVTLPVASSNPALLWGFVNLLQRFFYFLFFNVQYPSNLKAFLEICNLGTLSFLPNLFENIDVQLPSPPHFYKNEYPGSFYQSSGSTITLWIIALCAGGLVNLLHRIMRGRVAKITRIRNFLNSQIASFWQASFIELLYGALLQIQVIKFCKGAAVVPLVLAFIYVGIVFIYGVYLIRSIYKKPVSTPPLRKWVPCSEYLLKVLHPFCMIHFYWTPFQQVASLWTLNCLHLMFLFWAGVKHHKLQFFNECSYFLMHLVISFMIYDDIDPSTKDKLGWVIIGVCGFVLVVGIVAMVYTGIVSTLKTLKLLKSKDQGKKKRALLSEHQMKRLGTLSKISRVSTKEKYLAPKQEHEFREVCEGTPEVADIRQEFLEVTQIGQDGHTIKTTVDNSPRGSSLSTKNLPRNNFFEAFEFQDLESPYKVIKLGHIMGNESARQSMAERFKREGIPGNDPDLSDLPESMIFLKEPPNASLISEDEHVIADSPRKRRMKAN